jgi:predicted ArsR family transcriptional regulator
MRAALQIVQSAEKAAVLLQPGRLSLLQDLAEPNSAAGLARRLGVPRQKINYHLHELEREGFLELVEERRKGNCIERMVRATAKSYVIGPQAMGRLGETPEEVRDRFSIAYLVASAARVIRELAGIAARAGRAGKRVATLTLESEIRFASAEARTAFAEELANSLARLAAKYHDEHAEGGRRFRLLSACYPASSPKHEESEKESVNME